MGGAIVLLIRLIPVNPEWLSGMEPRPHTQSRVSVFLVFVVCLRAHVHLCQFDKADTTADIQ